jgi:phosphatidylinositol 4-kinase
MVNDSLSLDQLKHKLDHISLSEFYLHYFGNGNPNSDNYKNAIKNYIASLAGYSLVCYFLQIKDRHNGNILIDNQGHLIHIDFGFLLSNSPGKGIKFETAPFKLSKDFLDVMGGISGKNFEEFKKLMKKGFAAINKHRHKITILVEMMWCGHGKNLDCFEKGQEAINELKARLNPKDDLKKNDISNIVDDLINQSAESWTTKMYDFYQSHSNGIFY